MRFTLTGSDQLEQRIASECAAVASDLVGRLGANQLDALILGGGYGRGEGGVLAGNQTYNDYDLVLIHHIADRRIVQRHIDEVQRSASVAAGIHVDITPLHRTRMARLPMALTWYELAQGHRVIWGDGAALEPLGARTLAGVDPSEWGRLLLNRAFGVVLAQRRRRGAPVGVGAAESEVPFCLRQVMKAWLALGDVWLADRGCYVPSVVARRAAMLAQTESPPWLDRYLAAVEFKLTPMVQDDVPALDEDLKQCAMFLATALTIRPVARVRPLVGCWATLRHVPIHGWWPLWSYPRERLRLVVLAALLEKSNRFDWNTAERWWLLYG